MGNLDMKVFISNHSSRRLRVNPGGRPSSNPTNRELRESIPTAKRKKGGGERGESRAGEAISPQSPPLNDVLLQQGSAP